MTTRVEQGESYTVCSKCDKPPRGAEKYIRHQEADPSYGGYPGSGTSTGYGGGGDGGTGV